MVKNRVFFPRVKQISVNMHYQGSLCFYKRNVLHFTDTLNNVYRVKEQISYNMSEAEGQVIWKRFSLHSTTAGSLHLPNEFGLLN